MKKTLPQIFRDAAKLIDSNREAFCCHAIADVSGPPLEAARTGAEKVFHRLFKPRSEFDTGAYFSYARLGGGNAFENRERRVYALLLAAEIVRDMEDVP